MQEFREDELERYLYRRLLEKGYVPEDDELHDIAGIFFDYLVEQDIIIEVDEIIIDIEDGESDV